MKNHKRAPLMLSQAKVRFMYELHRNKDKLNDEERSDNGDTDVVLLVLTGEERDEHISDRADTAYRWR